MTPNTWDRMTQATDKMVREVTAPDKATVVLGGVNPRGNEANRTNREHGGSSTMRGSGGGHHVSRKTVRQRRRAGIRPNRGHNFDHRLRNDRELRLEAREAKAVVDTVSIVDRLIREFNVPSAIREDVEQELWVAVLEGSSERELRSVLPSIRTRLMGVAFGQFGDISMDAPTRLATTEGGLGTFADLIDQDGRFFGGQAPLVPDLLPTPAWRAEVRDARRAERQIAMAARAAAREGERQTRRAERQLREWRRSLGRVFFAKVRKAAVTHSLFDLEARTLLRQMGRGQQHRNWWHASPAEEALVRKYARDRYSVRLIAALTGLARNTITRITGPRADVGPSVRVSMRPELFPSRPERCERCGYSPSSHVPSSKARAAKIVKVCDRAVVRCRCGGWRSIYSVIQCLNCRQKVAADRAARRAA